MAILERNAFMELQKFISDFCGIPQSKIEIYSKLESDLRIYGDDAAELIHAYSKKYSVDINQFPADEFVAAEGDTILPLIVNIFTKSKKKRRDLTVLNLVNGIIEGRLDEDVISKH